MITGSLGPVLLEAEAAVEPLHEGQHVRVCVCCRWRRIRAP